MLSLFAFQRSSKRDHVTITKSLNESESTQLEYNILFRVLTCCSQLARFCTRYNGCDGAARCSHVTCSWTNRVRCSCAHSWRVWPCPWPSRRTAPRATSKCSTVDWPRLRRSASSAVRFPATFGSRWVIRWDSRSIRTSVDQRTSSGCSTRSDLKVRVLSIIRSRKAVVRELRCEPGTFTKYPVIKAYDWQRN